MSLEKGYEKLVLVLAISILLIAIKKEVFGDVETKETDENSENKKNGDEDFTNFARVFYIQNPITFEK